MTVSLHSLKVVTTGDSSSYVRAREQQVAADKKAIGSLEQTDRKLGDTGSRFERLARQIDPAHAAAQKLEAGQRTLQRALDNGSITTERHVQLMGLLQKRYSEAPQALNDNTRAMATTTAGTGQMRFALQNLGFQINDIATSLASGGSPMRVLAQQGGQVVQVFQQGGGVSSVLGAAATAIRGMVTPTTAAVAGVAALAGGVGLLIARAGSTEERLRSFDVILTGMGTRSNATAAGLDAVVRSLRETGTAADEALKAVQAFARTPGINPASAATLVPLARDIGAATGEDLTSVSKKIAGAFAESTEAAIKLVQSLTGPNGLTVAQITNMRTMSAHGDRAGALKVAVGALQGQFGGGFENSLSAGAKAINSIGTAWDNMLTALSKTAGVQAARAAVIGMLNGIANAASNAAPVTPAQSANAARSALGLPPLSPEQERQIQIQGLGQNNAPGGALRMDFEGRLDLAIAAARAAGYDVSRGSGFRSFSEQADLHLRDPVGAAPPGSSFHNLGLTNDLRGARGRLTAGELQNILPFLTAQGLHAPLANWEKRAEPWHIEPVEARQFGSGVFGNLGRGTSAAVDNGPSQKSLADLQQRQDLLDRYNVALRKTGEELIATRAYEEAWASSSKEGLERHWEAQTAAADAVAKHSIEIGKQADTQRLTNDLAMQTARAYGTDVVAGLQAAARAQAELDVRQGTASNAQARYNELLQTGAAEAVKSAAMALPGLRQQTEQSERLAEAVTKGAAAEHASELQIKISAATQDVLNASKAAGIDVNRGIVKSITDETEALIRRNAAAQATIKFARANISDRNEIEVVELQARLTGQTAEAISQQVAQLRVKQEWLEAGGKLNDAELINRLQVVDALGQARARLAETTREQQRWEEAVRGVASTIENTLGRAIEDAFNGKKITDWGAQLKSIVSSLLADFVKFSFIRPAIGTALGALGFGNVAQQFGGFGGGGSGLSLTQTGPNTFSLSNVSSLASLGNSTGLFGGSGGGMFSGITNWLNNSIGPSLGFQGTEVLGFAGSDIGAVPTFGAPGLFGSTTFSSFLGSAGAGFGAGMLVNSLAGGSQLGGTIGSGLGSLTGAAIGSIIPGIGTMLGALIGGAAGGGLGGPIGNQKPAAGRSTGRAIALELE